MWVQALGREGHHILRLDSGTEPTLLCFTEPPGSPQRCVGGLVLGGGGCGEPWWEGTERAALGSARNCQRLSDRAVLLTSII